ncbi:MAG: hypothetical protein WBK51_13955 [Polaromonas sp.]
MPTDSAPHLIVPFAHCSGEDWLQTISSIKLKNLGKLLQGMQLTNTDTGAADSLSPPHERACAKALGLTTADGLIPWAALEAKAGPDEAWAFITPCHWAMGREHATLTDPATLDLNEADSRTLLAAMQPYFATEGITLHYLQPTRWLAEGKASASLPTASLDRVLGRNVDRWLPASKAMKLLQNEMQMLLYTHPINDERAASRLRSVNSFWVSGSGALTEAVIASTSINVNRVLAQAAFANDWAAYTQAWMQLDNSDITALLAQQNNGNTVRISLCGESNAMTFETAQRSLLSKIKNTFSPQHPIDVLKQL